VKARILQLVGSFHQGGSERQALSITRLLHEEGSFEVHLATLSDEGILEAEADGIGLGDIPVFSLTSFFDPTFIRQVRSCAAYLKARKIDLIQTHDFYTNVFGMAAAKLAGTRVRIASKRETGVMRSTAQDVVEKIAFGQATNIVANSAAVREHLIRRHIPANKITVIHNGVDTSRFSVVVDRGEICRELGLPDADDLQFVVMVANLRHAVKNVPMLLRVARKVSGQKSKVHFVVAGEGELETELKQMAGELAVAENVHFIGRCNDVPSLLAAADVCVLTSTAEGFSNSIIEYMAAGRPVVATNVGGASEAIVEGDTGFIVDPDDDEAMAARLMEVLSDPEKAVKMGSRGRQKAANDFSQTSQLSKTLTLYKQCLS